MAQLVQRSLQHYWRTNLGVVLGAALGTMVLTGSLMVGDSVQDILRRKAGDRVGKVQSALFAGDRTVRASLAQAIGGNTTPVLMLRGSVARADGTVRLNQAQVLGVTPAFPGLHPGGAATLPWPEGAAYLNSSLATQLGVKKGETIIVRMEKPTAFSRDAPLSGEENETVALRVTVAGVLSTENFGDFGLQANQVPPVSVFLPLSFVQNRAGCEGRSESAAQYGPLARANGCCGAAALEPRGCEPRVAPAGAKRRYGTALAARVFGSAGGRSGLRRDARSDLPRE